MYLDAYENALILDGADEGDTIVIFLVECLMEEDKLQDGFLQMAPPVDCEHGRI